MSSFLLGVIWSCGLILIAAGLSKLVQVRRSNFTSPAVAAAFRVLRDEARALWLLIAFVELLLGFVLIVSKSKTLGCLMLLAAGMVFIVSLVVAKRARVPGGCGCVGSVSKKTEIDHRNFAVPCMFLVVSTYRLIVEPSASDVNLAIALAGVGVGLATALYAWWPSTSLRCSRFEVLLKRPRLRLLKSQPLFARIDASRGPLDGPHQYNRAGCAHAFTFTSSNEETLRFTLNPDPNGWAVHFVSDQASLTVLGSE